MTSSPGTPDRHASRAIAFFERLRALARLRPERIATVSPERTATYRKLWSRIERATARLQGEWGVQAGDTVALVGPCHADALVLWLALCRLGAALLPLESGVAPETSPDMLLRGLPDALRQRIKAEVHVDGHGERALFDGVPQYTLSDTIGAPCAHREIVQHEDGVQTCLREPDGTAWTLDALLEAAGAIPAIAQPYSAADVDLVVSSPVLRGSVLGAEVLPALMAGRRIVYPHADGFAPARSLR